MATIIKSGHRTTSAQEPQQIVFQMDDLRQQAESYLLQVQEQAATILEQANQQADAIRKQACQEGLQEAQQKAQAKLGKEIEHRWQTLLPALNKAITEVEQSRIEWIRHWEDNLVQLATAIAERILRAELSRQPELALENIRACLELSAGRGAIQIRLNPEDYRSLADRVTQLADEIGKSGDTEIVADPEISPAGCKIVTQYGDIDQQIEAQLARIAQELG